MMGIVSRGIAVCVLVGVVAMAAGAEEEPSASLSEAAITQPAKKVGFLGRLVNGTKNIILSPLDIPCTVARHASDSGNPITGAVTGILEGVVNGTVRAFAGALEVVTSPVPGKRYPLYQRGLGERCIRDKPAF